MLAQRDREASERLFREVWAEVGSALDQQYDDVQQGRPTRIERTRALHATIYDASARNQLVSDLPYHQLRRWLTASLEERVLIPLLAKFDGEPRPGDMAAICSEVQTSLDHFKRCVPFGKAAFHYLGAYHVKRSGHDSIEVMYRKAFGETVYQRIKGELVALIIKEVEAQRDGRVPFDPSALQNAARTFVEVATTASTGATQPLIANDFTVPYLVALRAAYGSIPLAVDCADADKYFEWVDGRLGFELALATDVFSGSDCDVVLHTAAAALSSPLKREILRGVTALLEGRDAPYLNQLCSEITDFKDKLCAILEKRIATVQSSTLTSSLLSSVRASHFKFVTLIQEHGALLERCPFASPLATLDVSNSCSLQVFLSHLNAARRNAALPSVATALKLAAELLLDVMAADAASAFEAEYRAAFSAFYVAPALSEASKDLHWVSRQVEFELAALPSSTSSLHTMIQRHFRPIVNSLATTMAGPLLDAWNQSDLACLYALAKAIDPSYPALHVAIENGVAKEATQVLRDFEAAPSDEAPSVEQALVQSIVELNNKYSKLIAECFGNDALMLNYRKLGFTGVLKVPLKRKDVKPSAAGDNSALRATDGSDTSFSEVLANFLDTFMKRELKGIMEHDAVTAFLDDQLTVFTYIADKDVFQEFYRVKLARRLLLTTPLSEDLEKGFLARLQREMGKGYTRRMEGMLLDRDSSRTLAEKFAQDSSSADLGVEFEVRVLTAANWPAFKTDTLRPPLSLQRCVDAFTRFYTKAHQTRQLTWISALGSASLTVLFPKGTKDVTATLHQASVLVLVDEAGQLSVRALAEALGQDAQALKPHVASMYVSKFPLLQLTNEDAEKAARVKTIGDDDCFAMNPEFKHSTRKFRLPTPLAKSVIDVNAPPIDANRKLQIDAAVVRIMKSHKTLNYAELQDITIEMLGKYFIVQPKMVKASVDELIHREYLKRHDDDPKMLDYLA